jgi:ATP-dependent RNA helicase RhlE
LFESISPVSKREKTELIIKLITRKLAADFSVYTGPNANKPTEAMISAGIKAAAIHGKRTGARKKH